MLFLEVCRGRLGFFGSLNYLEMLHWILGRRTEPSTGTFRRSWQSEAAGSGVCVFLKRRETFRHDRNPKEAQFARSCCEPRETETFVLVIRHQNQPQKKRNELNTDCCPFSHPPRLPPSVTHPDWLKRLTVPAAPPSRPLGRRRTRSPLSAESERLRGSVLLLEGPRY